MLAKTNTNWYVRFPSTSHTENRFRPFLTHWLFPWRFVVFVEFLHLGRPFLLTKTSKLWDLFFFLVSMSVGPCWFCCSLELMNTAIWNFQLSTATARSLWCSQTPIGMTDSFPLHLAQCCLLHARCSLFHSTSLPIQLARSQSWISTRSAFISTLRRTTSWRSTSPSLCLLPHFLWFQSQSFFFPCCFRSSTHCFLIRSPYRRFLIPLIPKKKNKT